MLGLGLRLRLPCLARVGVLEEVHLEVLKTWRNVEDLAREEYHLEDLGSRQARLTSVSVLSGFYYTENRGLYGSL